MPQFFVLRGTGENRSDWEVWSEDEVKQGEDLLGNPVNALSFKKTRPLTDEEWDSLPNNEQAQVALGAYLEGLSDPELRDDY